MISAAADGSTQANRTGVLEAMQSLGMNVMRAWAFNDGLPGTYLAVQTAPGQLQESVLR